VSACLAERLVRLAGSPKGNARYWVYCRFSASCCLTLRNGYCQVFVRLLLDPLLPATQLDHGSAQLGDDGSAGLTEDVRLRRWST
jgi:hypothetical protein